MPIITSINYQSHFYQNFGEMPTAYFFELFVMSIIESARVVQWLGCHASNVKIRVQFPAPAFTFCFYVKKLEHELINNRGE